MAGGGAWAQLHYFVNFALMVRIERSLSVSGEAEEGGAEEGAMTCVLEQWHEGKHSVYSTLLELLRVLVLEK